jgi:hypothetical protein
MAYLAVKAIFSWRVSFGLTWLAPRFNLPL